MTDITYPDKSTGDTFTADNANEIKSSVNTKADSSSIPSALSDLSDDSTHRTVTDAEKSTWNTGGGDGVDPTADNTWTGQQTFEDIVLPADGVDDTALDLGTGANQINQDTIVDGSTYVRTENNLTDALVTAIGDAGATIVRGTVTIPATAVPANTCNSAVTATATGVDSADVVVGNFNQDPTSVTGYGPGAAEGLYIVAWCSAGQVNFRLCNNTDTSITPGSALTLNWMVTL